MASLPSNTFICNYNARDFDGSRTIPKTSGQTFGEDLYLTSAVTSYDANKITLSGQYFAKSFNSTGANPFNRTSTDSLTVIAKLGQGVDTSGAHSVFSNRGNTYNWMVFNPANGSPVGMFFLHSSQGAYAKCPYIQMVDTTAPNIFAFRVSGGTGFGQSYTDNQVFGSTGVTWGGQSNRIAFFCGGSNGSELWKGDFYWIYISPEVLTDAEIQQVIKYNEKTSFETDVTAITASYNSTTSAVTLTADEDMAWTASTSNNWITLSTTGGTGSSVFTISIAANKAYTARNGLVTVSNGEDTIEITVEQGKCPLFIPAENIYRADLEVVKAYRSGSTINKAYRNGEMILWRRNPPTE